MSQVEIAEAQSNLLGLIERACNGEDVTLTSDGRAVARLLPVAGRAASSKAARRLGVAVGKLKILDGFDAPLPADLLDMFYDGPLFPADPTTAAKSSSGRDGGPEEARDEP